MEHVDQVTLHDIYARLGRLEEGQGETNEKLGELASQVASLCASLDGPSHLKDRIGRLESWRNKLIGGFLFLSFLVTVVGAFSAFAVLLR
jgi:hypothetical protein